MSEHKEQQRAVQGIGLEIVEASLASLAADLHRSQQRVRELEQAFHNYPNVASHQKCWEVLNQR